LPRAARHARSRSARIALSFIPRSQFAGRTRIGRVFTAPPQSFAFIRLGVVRSGEDGVGLTKRVWAIVAAVAAIGIGVGVGIGAAVWSGGDHAETSTTAMADDHGGSAMAGALEDRQFIEEMSPHHQLAVRMAEVAVERAEHPGVKQLARDIIDAQDREIAEMTSWYERWYGTTPEIEEPTEDDMAAMGMHGGMDALESATPFDKAFLAAMIPHHASAVVMANMLLAEDGRPELRRLARQIIAGQSREIGQMQRWRQAWYPPLG
jgi:uncharacterized protein (DUF305 family)